MAGNVCPKCGKAVMTYGRFFREAGTVPDLALRPLWRAPEAQPGRVHPAGGWVWGLLGGAHARALHSTRTPSQRRPAGVFGSLRRTLVAANHCSRST